jgi:hypothetical protein
MDLELEPHLLFEAFLHGRGQSSLGDPDLGEAQQAEIAGKEQGLPWAPEGQRAVLGWQPGKTQPSEDLVGEVVGLESPAGEADPRGRKAAEGD